MNNINENPVVDLKLFKESERSIGNVFLSVDGKYVYNTGVACSTCPFLFNHLVSHKPKLSSEEITEKLKFGLDTLDSDVISSFAALLGTDEYIVSILKITPDFKKMDLSEKQKDVYNYVTGFYGTIVTDFYNGRNWHLEIDETVKTTVQEVILPLTSTKHLNQDTVNFYRKKIRDGYSPTAVSYSFIEDRHPAYEAPIFWCLSHFLMDGHHKMYAAAMEKKPITLLSFFSKRYSGFINNIKLRFRPLINKFEKEIYMVDNNNVM